MELVRANQYIDMVCAQTGQVPKKFGVGMLPLTNSSAALHKLEGDRSRMANGRVTGNSDNFRSTKSNRKGSVQPKTNNKEGFVYGLEGTDDEGTKR